MVYLSGKMLQEYMQLLYHGGEKKEKRAVILQSSRIVYIWSIFLFLIFAWPTHVHAAPNQLIKATKLIQSQSELQLAPLAKKTLTIGFKNTGKNTWTSKKSALELRASVRGESYLHAPSWQSSSSVKKISAQTKPGELVYTSFTIEAPKKEGTYREIFALYTGGKKIAGTDAAFTVIVTAQKEERHIASLDPVQKNIQNQLVSSEQKKDPIPSPSLQTQTIQAQKLIQSALFLELAQYQIIAFTVGYKNTGTIPWTSDMTAPITLRSLVKKESYFYHRSWLSGNSIIGVSQSTAQGEVAYITFVLEAPVGVGNYQERLALFSGETKISGTDFSIPITVAKAPALLAIAPVQVQQSQQQVTSQTQYLIAPSQARPGIVDDPTEQEPNIRIGITATRDPIQITAQAPYEIRDGVGALLSTEDAGSISTVTFDFSTHIYSVATQKGVFTSQSLFRLQGVGSAQNHGQLIAAALEETTTSTQAQESAPQITPQQDIVFEILSFFNKPSWSSTINDNKYRTSLEVRYASATDKLWIINELPLEQYLKGIAETSNSAPYEYQKTMTIAARTYAKYHIKRSTKYADENFTVRTTDADQVYRGYNSELRLPGVSKAVAETRGVMVFYNNALAITPYYSQSDGRTRSWGEVWGGGPYPWLVSKDDPACKGLPLLGHGVGISARGAVAMALEGKTAEEILTYYYTGVELHRRY